MPVKGGGRAGQPQSWPANRPGSKTCLASPPPPRCPPPVGPNPAALAGGSKAPRAASAGTLFRGGSPRLRNTRMVIQAMDPAQFLVQTNWVAVKTETAQPVANFLFRSDCWNGGFEKQGALVEGQFRWASLCCRLPRSRRARLAWSSSGSHSGKGAGGCSREQTCLTEVMPHFSLHPPPPLLRIPRNSQFLIYTSGSIEGRIFNFAATSANNTLSMGNNAAAGEWALATQADSPRDFNGGSPAVEQVGATCGLQPRWGCAIALGPERLTARRCASQLLPLACRQTILHTHPLPPLSIDVQGLWASVRTKSDWLPTQTRTFYLYSYFAQAANPATLVRARARRRPLAAPMRVRQEMHGPPLQSLPLPPSLQMHCIPFVTWNPGVICQVERAPSSGPSGNMQVAVRWALCQRVAGGSSRGGGVDR